VGIRDVFIISLGIIFSPPPVEGVKGRIFGPFAAPEPMTFFIRYRS
jgi:hypothetical protein